MGELSHICRKSRVGGDAISAGNLDGWGDPISPGNLDGEGDPIPSGSQMWDPKSAVNLDRGGGDPISAGNLYGGDPISPRNLDGGGGGVITYLQET